MTRHGDSLVYRLIQDAESEGLLGTGVPGSGENERLQVWHHVYDIRTNTGLWIFAM